MSSTNRGAIRDTDDHYATPPDLALLIAQHLRDDWYSSAGRPFPMKIMEPGCGEGAFLEACSRVWSDAIVFGVEVLPELVAESRRRGHKVLEYDFLEAALPERTVDLSLTNPPFIIAETFVRKTLSLVKLDGYAGFLLRLNFFGGLARFAGFWKPLESYLHHIYQLPARPSFVPDGRKDSIEYMVVMFSPTPRAPGVRTTFSFIDNTQIKNCLRGDEVKTTFIPNSNRKGGTGGTGPGGEPTLVAHGDVPYLVDAGIPPIPPDEA